MVEDRYPGGRVLDRLALLLSVMLVLSGCTRSAEVFVTFDGEGWWLQQVSYRGCSWPGVLEPGESTTIGHCVEGVGPVSFQARPDPDEHAEDDPDDPDDGLDSGLEDDGSGWRWYRTDERFQTDTKDVQELLVRTGAWTEEP